MVVDHTRDEDRAGQQTSRSTRTSYSLVWRQAADGAGRLTMTPVDFTAGPGAPAQLAEAQLPKRPIELEVDEALTPSRIVNEAEVRADFERMLDRMLQGQQAEAQAMAKQFMNASFATLVTRDLAMVSLCLLYTSDAADE